MKLRPLLIIIPLTALAGCSKEKVASTDGVEIAVHSTIRSLDTPRTRVTGNAFEEGDRIGITIKTTDDPNFAQNEPMTHNGSHFKADDLKWYHPDLSATFEAYYPYCETYPLSYKICEDQTSSGYTKSDLLMAVANNVKPNMNGVALEFQHVMTQVVISIENESGFEISTVKLGNTKETVVLDHATMSTMPKVASERITITAQKITDESYRAIISPGKADLEIVIANSQGVEAKTTFESTTFISGMSYTATVTIGEDFDITDHDITTTGDEDIKDWGDGGALTEA